ncbi:muconolactone delta-isomerase [Thioclava dalianensis]|uniref:Muconolactone Delta-isomerase n=1 Tax=Thioclava dalianensis TaxID=1185766 RepID=A0A074TNH4_9RHOB|nr:muconolactone Delta-isomerase [Thioclava dalianensis]KEP70558.1 muconolactone delta-isomerase [Thioclava dalianensis]SFN07624.1 muconolactone D-isomerase [Thioclava dalianensis]
MLYHVKMKVNLPADMDPERAAEIKAREKAYSQDLQKQGIWRHIWRIAGLYENISILDCRDHAHLHEVLMGLPLYPWMEMEIMPLCRHPSSVREGDQ